jgi:hypothetical protein
MNDSTLDDIETLVQWYHDLPDDYQGLNDLIYVRRKLASLSFNFANFIIKPLGRDWKRAASDHYSKKHQLRVNNHDKGVVKAQDISRANSANLYKKELESEADYWSAISTLATIDNVLTAMNQDISHLKEEIKYFRYTNGNG